MNNFKKISLLALVFLFLPLSLVAVTETGVGSNITSEVIPRDPAPGSMVIITLTGFGFDNNKAYYVWSQDGLAKKSGVGEKTFSFQLGELGKPTTIKASISYGQKPLADKNFYFEPSDINFIWQTDTLVPPFYRGKARAVEGAKIKIVATPYLVNSSGQNLKTGDLLYNWYIDDSLDKTISGLGKNIVSIRTPKGASKSKINLKVSSTNGKSNASKSLIIYLDKPEIAFYEQVPLEGTNYKKQVINTFSLYGEEASFIAFPLFWPLDQISNLDYTWRVNNLVSLNPTAPNSLTVRRPSNGVGINQINLEVSSKNNEQKSINSNFDIKFGNNLLKSYNGN